MFTPETVWLHICKDTGSSSTTRFQMDTQLIFKNIAGIYVHITKFNSSLCSCALSQKHYETLSL